MTFPQHSQILQVCTALQDRYTYAQVQDVLSAYLALPECERSFAPAALSSLLLRYIQGPPLDVVVGMAGPVADLAAMTSVVDHVLPGLLLPLALPSRTRVSSPCLLWYVRSADPPTAVPPGPYYYPSLSALIRRCQALHKEPLQYQSPRLLD